MHKLTLIFGFTCLAGLSAFVMGDHTVATSVDEMVDWLADTLVLETVAWSVDRSVDLKAAALAANLAEP